RILKQREAGQDYVENLLEREISQARLSAPDRALLHELTAGVVRWQATLDWLIDRKTAGRQQKPALRILLRLGLYQLFWLDRVPQHAAVHETVELARQLGFGPQSGFINAVLRGYGREVDSTRRLLADLKTSQPHLGHSHPAWLVERWTTRWGVENVGRLLEWNNTPPLPFARVNTLKTTISDLLWAWQEEGVEGEPCARDWMTGAQVFQMKKHPSITSLKSFQDGWFYIQDPSTLLAVGQLNPQPGETILDLCSAPGGKTTFIAQLMQNRGRIVAQDSNPERLKLVSENCARLGATCVETVSTSTFNAQPSTRFDRILVDAPCSNTGVMRRRIDLRWRIRSNELERLRREQLNLLNKAALELKPGGTLVYSTCSLEPEENNEAVKQFLTENSGFVLANERELLPFVDGVDGAYVATLQKP
ncbi:MAG: 16S rRNA (cytosine(967)-C(5))-methyltransferase RsmB, partial [Pedosphaera parvula]|nr:16S rRNA (cytosine(967)-C(5))-methyltransferase RsmB [Pedosphaera parvula]